MSAFQAPALDAIAFQLAAALETYDLQTSAMVDGWPDLERYRTVSEQIETIRMFCTSLPQLSVPWVELLIAHSELVHCLWRVEYGAPLETQEHVQPLRARHAQSVATLRTRALRLIARRDDEAA